MRNYECLFIANPNIEGDGMSSVVEKVTAYVKEAGAEVANIQHWGKRRLAYQIEKQQYGNYVLMYINGEAPKIVDLQRSFELDSTILAYLTIRLDEMPEFDKVFIPEDDGEEDRRGGRSRYEGSRGKYGSSAPTGPEGKAPVKDVVLEEDEEDDVEMDVDVDVDADADADLVEIEDEDESVAENDDDTEELKSDAKIDTESDALDDDNSDDDSDDDIESEKK